VCALIPSVLAVVAVVVVVTVVVVLENGNSDSQIGSQFNDTFLYAITM